MIECSFIKIDDVRVAALVVRMAGRTFFSEHFFCLAVVSQAQFNINRDEFVAVKAEVALF